MEIACRRLLSRHFLRGGILSRTIMTSTSRTEKAVEELEKNPYFEKYAAKIAQLQKTSPEEFLARVEGQQKSKEKKAKPLVERNFASLLQPKKALSSSSTSEVRDESLDKIMKVDLIKDKDRSEIEEIWTKYHMQKDVLAATIPAGDYGRMVEQAKTAPTFLFALPRSQGYEFFVSQFHGNTVHFTPLICYQVHKENAPECLTLTHYTEFKDDKGVVLMRGEYDDKVVDSKEAQCLANQLQIYYDQKDGEKTALLKRFNSEPEKFRHMDLIKQIESIKLT